MSVKTKKDRKALLELRRVIKMENASFGRIFEYKDDPLPKTEAEVTEFIKRRTHIYFNSWALPIVNQLLGEETGVWPEPAKPTYSKTASGQPDCNCGVCYGMYEGECETGVPIGQLGPMLVEFGPEPGTKTLVDMPKIDNEDRDKK